jgi:uncharacterized protein YqeY
MLIEQIKAAMMSAMKAKNVTEKEILRTCIGEVTGTGETPDDARVQGVLRKMIKNNEETLVHSTSAEQKATLETEIGILRRYLPQSLSVDQIVLALAPVRDAIVGAAGAGQATGVAMKHLKAGGLEASGKDVGQAVAQLRG